MNEADPIVHVSTPAIARFSLQFGNAQHQGARNYQEDYFGFSDTSPETVAERGMLAVLCDGMGGLKGGRQTAIETVSDILNFFKTSDLRHSFRANMSKAVSAVNAKILSKYNASRVNTGCTLATAYIFGSKLHWACVGDSRVYLAREGHMYALNEDHDYLNQLLLKHISGDVSLKKAVSDPQKDSLASHIGCKKLKGDISATGLVLQENDAVILCSDGIYNSISECEMLRYIEKNDAYNACDKIVQNIVLKAKPSQDNMSIMMIRVTAQSDAPQK